MYNPHPLLLLEQPPSKTDFKNSIKLKIIDYWQEKLRAHCANLKSLKYFKPHFMSLTKPHPILMHSITSYDTNKIVTVCKMLSGRFCCRSLVKHITENDTDLCELCGDKPEDLVHTVFTFMTGQIRC